MRPSSSQPYNCRNTIVVPMGDKELSGSKFSLTEYYLEVLNFVTLFSFIAHVIARVVVLVCKCDDRDCQKFGKYTHTHVYILLCFKIKSTIITCLRVAKLI